MSDVTFLAPSPRSLATRSELVPAADPYPVVDTPLAAGDADMAAVARDIEGIGGRPKDYATYDFLTAGTFADGRMKILHRQLSEVPEVILATVSQLEPSVLFGEDGQDRREQIRNVLIYMHHHYGWLDGLRSIMKEGEDRDLWLRLWNCPPVGLLFSREDGRFLRSCKRPRLCPYCLTRQVVRRWQQLDRQLELDTPQRRCLLQVRALADDLSFAISNPLCLAGPDAVDHIREHVEPVLREFADDVGADGGALFFQMLPKKLNLSGDQPIPSFGEHGYMYCLSLLAEIPSPCETVEDFPRCLLPDEVGIEVSCSTWRLPANRRNLRALLLGPSRRSQLCLHKWRPGAVVNPPWSLFQTRVPPGSEQLEYPRFNDQWLLYRLAISDERLWRNFGSWDSHQSILQAANTRRHAESVQRIETVLEVARPVWRELHGRSGTKPGRVRFKQALAAAGLQLSERVVRQLIPRLETQASPSTPA